MSDIEYDTELGGLLAEVTCRHWKWSEIMEALGDHAGAQAAVHRDNDRENTADQLDAISSHCHGMARILSKGRM
jgi:hypothetical protein